MELSSRDLEALEFVARHEAMIRRATETVGRIPPGMLEAAREAQRLVDQVPQEVMREAGRITSAEDVALPRVLTREEPRWEYLVVDVDAISGDGFEADINERGAQGWELVSIANGKAIFKRPL